MALVREWKRQGRSVGPMKNRAAHLRLWAAQIGRPGVVPSNGELGIANRQYMTSEDRSVALDPEVSRSSLMGDHGQRRGRNGQCFFRVRATWLVEVRA